MWDLHGLEEEKNHIYIPCVYLSSDAAENSRLFLHFRQGDWQVWHKIKGDKLLKIVMFPMCPEYDIKIEYYLVQSKYPYSHSKDKS